MNEEWKSVVGYEGLYEVSSLGRIKSIRSYGGRNQRIMKPATRPDGYLSTSLSKNGKAKTWLIHRLVAIAFIPNPMQLTVINHKDENKANNAVSNLEWCTKSYNQLYSLKLHPERRYVFGNNFRDKKTGELISPWTKRVPKKYFNKVLQYTADDVLVAEHDNVTEAAKATGIRHGGIIYACRMNKNPKPNRKTHKNCKAKSGGFIWRFAEKDSQ